MTYSNESLEQIVTSLARSAQAIADDHEERIRFAEQRIERLEDIAARLTSIEQGQNRMLASIDEDRPTVLRKLNSIENKIDRLLEN